MTDISKIKSDRIDDGIKPGDICYSLRTEKEGWLLCNGASYLTTDYPDLFSVIGYTFGGSNSQFNVPNYSGKFLQMDTSKTIGQNIEAGLPNITGELMYYRNNASAIKTGVFSSSISKSESYAGNTSTNGISMTPVFDASKSNSIYGKSNTVQPPASIVNYFIKY